MAKVEHKGGRISRRAVTLWNALLFCYFIENTNNIAISISAQTIEDNMESVQIIEAVEGTIGRLPCNITPSMNEDKVILVLWYKDGHTLPIYSFDARTADFDERSHRFDRKTPGNRAYFQASATPAALVIDGAQDTDSGIYRCRVDFDKSPTRHYRVQLKIILPPEKLIISDENGAHMSQYTFGPYMEGSSVNISCTSIGGRPLPNITWWHETTLLDDTSVILSNSRVKNILTIKKIERRHLHLVYTCQASNNNVTMPIVGSFAMDVNLRPLSVELQGENHPLSANNEYQLKCSVIGSRPPPIVTWWMGSTLLRDTKEIHMMDGNLTQSILSFTPIVEDRGKYLSCRAEHSSIPESGSEDGWKLDIHHKPVVSLELGTNSNTSSIHEGADVYFECNIKSNPWVFKVSWRHNNRTIQSNLSEGITVANQSLVLQNVNRNRNGIYTCVGSNQEGDGESNAVLLDIKYAPVCRSGQRLIYSGARQEIVKVLCELDANPKNVSFAWKFNSSATEFLDLPIAHIFPDKSNAVVIYTPMTEHDYGSLLCWGANEIGAQIEPCIFTIIPSGKPDALTNCTILNQTHNSFQIDCIEGFDGGLPQQFILEAYTMGQKVNPIILKSSSPFFELRNLNAGVGYNVFLIAQNAKGRSNSTVRQVFTLNNPEKQTDTSSLLASTPSLASIKTWLPYCLFGVAGCITLTAMIILFSQLFGNKNNIPSNNDIANHIVNDAAELDGNATYAINAQQMLQPSQAEVVHSLCSDNIDGIEKNPDIIPQDENAFQWINKGNHSQMYEAQPVGEQAAFTTNMIIPQNSQQLQNMQQQHMQNQFLQSAAHAYTLPHYMTTQLPEGNVNTISLHPHITSFQQYNQPTPLAKRTGQLSTNPLAFGNLQRDVIYAELMVASPIQQPHYTSTLGRQRTTKVKQEPTIYAQIDLAQPSTNNAAGSLNQLTETFPSPPALFSNRLALHEINALNETTPDDSNSNQTVDNRIIYPQAKHFSPMLQSVPEVYPDPPPSCDGTIYAPRF